MTGESIAGRYRVERRLASGGMGEVLVVMDESIRQRVALKRLLEGHRPRVASMFEREYHALASLRHPRIIEVFEYGVDRGRPYYTMELLDGQDLRRLAPLSYRRACGYLRDVASALALLHARRMLHRDVSARNVIVTGADRGTLIDFGALTSFGTMDVVVGTPPHVPPEAMQHAALDQRSDLFALGALSYWLLTGRHAFPARSIHELPDLWRQSPPPPSRYVGDAQPSQGLDPIPRELDELVLSLLTPDPLGRPGSAEEVIERLSAAAELEPEQGTSFARSYFQGSPTVGRAHEQGRLRKRLSSALAGAGASVLLDAEPGMGSTKLLTELALDAQLSGLVPVMVDSRVHRDTYGTAHALIEKLMVSLPEESARAAADHRATLARFSPLFGSADDPEERSALPPGELRGRMQQALAEWFFALARAKPLLIAIDNVQRTDEASSALLATLARNARNHAFALVVVRKVDETPASPLALRGIEEAATGIRLRPLSRDEVHALVCGIFGAVHYTERLADWLHRLSFGNPRACMDLVRHLVDTAEIRFVEGVWVLPQELSSSELPESLDDALSARLLHLGTDAKRLAETLAVHLGFLPIERCLSVARAAGVSAPHEALDELVRKELLVQGDASYHFVHEAVRQRIYAGLERAEREKLHRVFGHCLSAESTRSVSATLDAGWHLIHGGAEREGAELLARAGAALVHNTDDLAAAVPALRAALDVFRRSQRSKRELVQLLAPLAMAGYRVDRRLASEYGEETLEFFRELIGLELAERLRSFLGARLSLYVGLTVGVLGAVFVHGRRGIAEFKALVTAFLTCATALTGSAALCLDREQTRRYARVVEPFAVLGPEHLGAILYDFTRTVALLLDDRMGEVASNCKRLIARVEDTSRPIPDLTQETALLLRGGLYHALGTMEVYRGGVSALRCAERLDGLGLSLFAISAEQIRALYHAFRGEAALANQHRARLETLAIQFGSAWQVEVWAPVSRVVVSLLTRDVIGGKRVVEELDRLSVEIPSLEVHHQLARMAYFEMKGKPDVADEIYRGLPESHLNGGFLGWPAAAGVRAAALIALGRAREARDLAASVIDAMSPANAPYVVMHLPAHVSLAFADAALGDARAAISRIDRLISEHRGDEGPLTLGSLHGARARLSLEAGDLSAAREHFEHMQMWFRATGNSVLIAQCERLQREIARATHAGETQASDGSARLSSISFPPETDEVRSALSQCQGPDELAQRALDLIVQQAHGEQGYLLLYDRAEDRLRLLAPQNGEEPPTDLELAALDAVHHADELEDAPTDIVPATGVGIDIGRSSIEVRGEVYRMLLLTTLCSEELTTVGLVAVREGAVPLVSPQSGVLSVVARSLLELARQRTTARPLAAAKAVQ
ncbi:MAG TPA: protein kinase [Polyangiaceae bacterium]|nr:protein kinase [Polyangiaceae bacterium]